MSDFIDGLSFKKPHGNAPPFVKAKGSIKVVDLGKYLKEAHNNGKEWVNFDLKESREGKLYATIDDWKPDASKRQEAPQSSDDFDNDIPF